MFVSARISILDRARKSGDTEIMYLRCYFPMKAGYFLSSHLLEKMSWKPCMSDATVCVSEPMVLEGDRSSRSGWRRFISKSYREPVGCGSVTTAYAFGNKHEVPTAGGVARGSSVVLHSVGRFACFDVFPLLSLNECNAMFGVTRMALHKCKIAQPCAFLFMCQPSF